MFFSEKSDLAYLDFSPRRPYFSMAQVEWRGLVLNNHKDCDQPIVDLSAEPFEDLIINLFGKLDFIELFELHKALSSHPDILAQIDWSLLFSLTERQWNQRCEELFAKLELCPSSFIDWAFERKMQSRDLMPINSLTNLDNFSRLAESFKDKNLSRNDGKKIIDLLVDLLLMQNPLEGLMPTQDNWYEQLFKLRNPRTIEADMNLSDEKSDWPQYVQVQNLRQGDKIMKRMLITYLDKNDLSKKLTRLQTRENQ